MTKIRPTTAARLVALGLAAMGMCAAGYTQTQPDQIDHVERPPGRLAPGFNRQDARLMRPGALLLASYDRNLDGVITIREIDDGAEGSFQVADRDGDGVLGGFEQSDWARAVGGGDDVLANPMLFDADLDRQTTREEFIAGVKRLAASAETEEPGVLRFGDLTRPLGDGQNQGRRQPPT